jgi:very-short-patch-repair endonuclease
MRPKSANRTESKLVSLAANQHGVVSLAQLKSLGISRRAARYRADTGRLHRVHRGVYAVGHSGLSDEGVWMAAVLAVGPPAVLSHRAAAALWRLLAWRAGIVDVTVRGDAGRQRREGIRVHRSRTLPSSGCTRRSNIPVTTPARTLTDLRRYLTDPEFNTALRQAEVQGYAVDGVAIAGREPTRSELEHRLMALCRRHRLPLPECNAPVGRHQADFLWRDARLIAETDGWRFHRGRASFELDRSREAELARAGYEVMRFSWRQVTNEPGAVAAAVRGRL